MPQKLLITDLDNTLYDWVTYFSTSFRAMVTELTRLLEVSEDTLLKEFKIIHQRYGNSEQPFAALEFPTLSRLDVLERIDPALHQFNSTRKKTLVLYDGVAETLAEIRDAGVKIVGHTEAIVANSYWRLRALGLEPYFCGLYTLQGMESTYMAPNTRWADPPKGFVTIVPREERKPNPRLLKDIYQREGVERSFAYYIGDSLVRDVAMAKEAGVTAIWARYGTSYDRDLWSYLVRVTHWTDEDGRRETVLMEKYQGVTPDYTIDTFRQLKSIILSD